MNLEAQRMMTRNDSLEEDENDMSYIYRSNNQVPIASSFHCLY
jgi:hypothetical protein